MSNHDQVNDYPDGPVTLQFFIDQQDELQQKMPKPHPIDLFEAYDPGPFGDNVSDEQRKPAIDFIHWNVTATVDELHELLGEIGWKPWAKSKHINLEAAKGEWIDAFHFMLNLAMVLGLDAEEIKQRYIKKHEKNAQRQADSYDGVSTKCPGCHRALDDDAVSCFQSEADPKLYRCEQKEVFIRRGSDGQFRWMKPGLV